MLHEIILETEVEVSQNVTDRIESVIRAALEEQGIPFSTVMAPQKVPQHTDSVPAALRDYHNEEADQFLSVLEG